MPIINGVGRVGIRQAAVSPAPSPSIITSGLVLNLDAGNSASYPGTGTVWTDLSGNGNNGTLINGTSYSSANGGTLVFDGINDYVDTSLVTNVGGFTYCVWGKSASKGYPNKIMGNTNALNGVDGASIIWGIPSFPPLGIYENLNKMVAFRRTGNNYSKDIFSTEIPNFTNNWHYIVLTYDPANGSKLYCDNVLVGSNATSGFASTLTIRIGRDGNGSDAFLGNVSQVQVYNKGLTASEINTNFNATKTRFGL